MGELAMGESDIGESGLGEFPAPGRSGPGGGATIARASAGFQRRAPGLSKAIAQARRRALAWRHVPLLLRRVAASAHVPVTPREYLDLMRALEADLADQSVDDFYRLSRALLVKDERHLDKFDVVFAAAFKGVLSLSQAVETAEIPEEWLRKLAERYLTPRGARRDREARLRQADGDAAPAPRRTEGPPSGRLEMDRHGREPRRSAPTATIPRACASARTAGAAAARSRSGTSASSRIFPATRSWGRATSASRCAACAASRARARTRSSTSTARSARPPTRAISTCKLRPERRNAVKVLLFLDVGGSMDWHVEAAENLFSAARLQFKRLEHFYFHNCLYESVWKNNRRRFEERTPTARHPQRLRPRPSRHLRRRRRDEPARNPRARRLGRAPQSRSPARSG